MDRLVLNLKGYRAVGVSGFSALGSKAVEGWVRDIYSNQMHQVGRYILSVLVVVTVIM